MKTSITIDVSRIDEEIAELQSQIDKLQAFRQHLNSYASSSTTTSAAKPGRPAKTARKKSVRQKRRIAKKGKVIDFVTTYISENPGTAGRPIAEAYAAELGKDPKDTINIIYNTLSRLKKMDKIQATKNKDGSGFSYSVSGGSKPVKKRKTKAGK